jgi:hypothetical protein
LDVIAQSELVDEDLTDLPSGVDRQKSTAVSSIMTQHVAAPLMASTINAVRIAVGSENSAKLRSVQQCAQDLFGNVDIVGFKVRSNESADATDAARWPRTYRINQ